MAVNQTWSCQNLPWMNKGRLDLGVQLKSNQEPSMHLLYISPKTDITISWYKKRMKSKNTQSLVWIGSLDQFLPSAFSAEFNCGAWPNWEEVKAWGQIEMKMVIYFGLKTSNFANTDAPSFRWLLLVLAAAGTSLTLIKSNEQNCRFSQKR